jgi:hypothetical protein
MHQQRRLILTTAVVGVISIFLPWIKISLFGFSKILDGMHGIGIVAFCCFIAIAVLSFIGKTTNSQNQTIWGITLVAGAGAFISTVIFFIKASNPVSGSSAEFGIYIACLAALGVLAFAYFFREKN